MEQVADALAKADGLAEKNLSPVPEGLLKEAQQAAEEQRSMPGVVDTKSTGKKHELPAGLEKMFQQAEAEQKVEKKAKEGTEVPPAPHPPPPAHRVFWQKSSRLLEAAPCLSDCRARHEHPSGCKGRGELGGTYLLVWITGT